MQPSCRILLFESSVTDPVLWQLAPEMAAKLKSSNYLQLSLSAYIASECVLTGLLYQCSEKPNLKQHPSCRGCQSHLGNSTGCSALRIVLYLGAILLCTGKVGEGRVVHDWDCVWDNSTQVSFIIHLYDCQIWTVVTRKAWYPRGKCPKTPLQSQADQEFIQDARDPISSLSSLLGTQAQLAGSGIIPQNK